MFRAETMTSLGGDGGFGGIVGGLDAFAIVVKH